MTDFTAVNSEVQKLIDKALLDDSVVDAVTLKAALDADAAADAVVLKAKDDEIARLTAALAACEAGHTGDTQAPSTPTGGTATVVSASQITYNWTASTDNTAVVGYDVFRNGALIGTRVGTSYADSGLTAATTYSYSVQAKDAAGNVSAMSAAVTAKTQGTVTPPTTGFPDATNTGVPAGTALTAYTGPKTISTAGTVIDSKTISGDITVTAANVTIKRCKISNGSVFSTAATNFLLQDCELAGNGQLTGWEGKGTMLRCNVHNYENASRPSGVFVIKDCWLHTPQAPGADPHYDGIEVYSKTTDGLIEHNWIDYKDTSCVFISNLWGPQDNVRVNNNKLTGADVLCRFEGNKGSGTTTNVSFTNNMCGPSYYQQVDVVQCSPTFSGNVDLNGKPLSATYLKTNQPN